MSSLKSSQKMQKLEADTQNYFGNNVKDKIIGLEKEKRERSELHFTYENANFSLICCRSG